MICRLPLLTVVTELRTPTRWQDRVGIPHARSISPGNPDTPMYVSLASNRSVFAPQ